MEQLAPPRIGYKINFNPQTLLRFNIGTGFRVVNIFTEDHAALTGARNLVIEEELAPEQSYNANINFYKKLYTSSGWIIGLETAAWHTYFSNQILPDYDSNPNEKVYQPQRECCFTRIKRKSRSYLWSIQSYAGRNFTRCFHPRRQD